MIYKKGSVDYDINLCSLREMEEVVPMTLLERSRLRSWAKEGHDVDSNPWKIFEPDGSNMNYLKAHRIRFGVSHGLWDSWEYAPHLCEVPDGMYVVRYKRK